MNYQDTCRACDEAYKASQVDAKRQAMEQASKALQEAKVAYLNARDAYHEIYHKLWAEFNAN